MNCKDIAKINKDGFGKVPLPTTAQEIHCVFKGEKPIAWIGVNNLDNLESIMYLLKNKSQYPYGDIRIDAITIYNPKIPDAKYYSYIFTNKTLLSKCLKVNIDYTAEGILLGYSKEDIKGYTKRLECLPKFIKITEDAPKEVQEKVIKECWLDYAQKNKIGVGLPDSDRIKEAQTYFDTKFEKNYNRSKETIARLVNELKNMKIF